MPQLLLELFSEEIPARMQAQAGRDLARMAEERLKAAGLPYERLETSAGPRRLTLVVEGLPAAQQDRSEEIKGPRATAPEQALDGFLRKTGLSRADLTERDGVLYAVIAQKGRPTPQIIAEMVEAILRAFPWPKSMRWGSGTFRWVRPLKRILCLFDGQVVPFEVEGIRAGDLTEGHRFMGASHEPIRITHFDQYRSALLDHFVILDQADRKRLILDGARAACAAKGVALVEDEGLLDEVSGLAEWPAPVLGDMDPDFLDLPPEVIRTSMRTHQKYFAVRPASGTDGKLAPHFVVVANIAAADGGAVIAAGNAKVLSARLSDARFFWTEDRKVSLEDRLETLKGVVFHAKLGTLYERVERIEALAREIAPLVGADPDLAARAARLAKADLGTGMVGEFPELQGIMGGYYARAEGLESGSASFETPTSPAPQDDEAGRAPTDGRHAEEAASAAVSKHARWFTGLTPSQVDQVADAVRDHYKPIGPSDTVPTAPVTVAVALADKLDTLVGFFAIDEKPTGSRDPFALRRAALGVIRLALASSVRPEWIMLTMTPFFLLKKQRNSADILSEMITFAYFVPKGASHELIRAFFSDLVDRRGLTSKGNPDMQLLFEAVRVYSSLRDFILERLEVSLREKINPTIVAASSILVGQGVNGGNAIDDDLVRIVARVEALSAFLATEDGANLLAGYKRAVNILKAEEKRASLPPGGGGIEGGGAGATSAKGGAVPPIPDPSPSRGEGSLHLNPELSDHAPSEEAALDRRPPHRGRDALTKPSPPGGFHRRHAPSRALAGAGGRLLRQGAGERSRSRCAAEPPKVIDAGAGYGEPGGGLFVDLGIEPPSCSSRP